MAATRYTLTEQLHFLARDGSQREVVVTLQSWKNRTGSKGIYIKTHNGVEEMRRFYDTTHGATLVQRSFNLARQMAAAEDETARVVMLSEDAAADEVARRGGPHPRYCLVGDCGAQIPYAAAQCADGHPFDQLPQPGTYAFGSARRPPMTLIRGGKK